MAATKNATATTKNASKKDAAPKAPAKKANAEIRTLAHLTENFSTPIGEKSAADLVKEVKEAGFKLGTKTLEAMLSGEKETAGDFHIVMVKPGKAKPAPKAADKKVEAAPAAEENWAFKGQSLQERAEAAAGGKKKELTPAQAKLAQDAETAMPTQEKKSFRGTDWSKVLPQSPVAVRKDSVIHRLLVRLCAPEGASKAQLMEEFGWSAGGLAGIIHWEPKAKGYFLGSEKRDGVIYYQLQYIGSGGKRVKADEVLFKEKAVAAPKEPKAPKAPKAAAAPAEPKAPKVKVTKEQMAAVPMGGASVTKRVAAKKAPAPTK